MDHNISASRELRKRPNHKKASKDFVYENPCKTNRKTVGEQKSFPCKGCANVFNNKKTLMNHQAQCLTVKVDLTKQGSFFGDYFNKSKENSLSPNNREEKILPSSQPLVSYSPRIRETSKSYAEAASPSNKPQLTAVPITVT